MTCVPPPADMTTALRGCMPVTVPRSTNAVNNNRNNASLPRAGD